MRQSAKTLLHLQMNWPSFKIYLIAWWKHYASFWKWSRKSNTDCRSHQGKWLCQSMAQSLSLQEPFCTPQHPSQLHQKGWTGGTKTPRDLSTLPMPQFSTRTESSSGLTWSFCLRWCPTFTSTNPFASWWFFFLKPHSSPSEEKLHTLLEHLYFYLDKTNLFRCMPNLLVVFSERVKKHLILLRLHLRLD